MNLQNRIVAFSYLGNRIVDLLAKKDENLLRILHKTSQKNPWFSKENINYSLCNINHLLAPNKLKTWVSRYNIPTNFSLKKVAVILAGNIPLVGFHDVLCVLISGYKVLIKLSSKDNILLKFVLEILTSKYANFNEQIFYVDSTLPQKYDAVIATGSNSSAHYFESYFKHVPHIIRKNRTSIAIITKSTTKKELENLGKDIFTYYGLGCRNVSKIFLPKKYDISKLKNAWQRYKIVVNNYKYYNNYSYNKIIALMNKEKYYDFGFVILKEHLSLFSPIGVLYIESYSNLKDLEPYIAHEKENIQCIISEDNIPFGESQSPQLSDYADSIDTMQFLTTLNA